MRRAEKHHAARAASLVRSKRRRGFDMANLLVHAGADRGTGAVRW
jgi:hypothetical protein